MILPLAARSVTLALAIYTGVTAVFAGYFFTGLRNATIDCNPNTPGDQQPNQNWITCAADLFQTAVSAALIVTSYRAGIALLPVPIPGAPKRDVDMLHPMLQNRPYAFIHYREPDQGGMHRIYYMDNLTHPTKIRTNLADRGIHKDHLTDDNLRYHASLAYHHSLQKRALQEQTDIWVDINGDPNLANDVDPRLATDSRLTAVTTDMINYMVTNTLNSSCFKVTMNNADELLPSPITEGIVQIGPSVDNSSTFAPEPADCGSTYDIYTNKIAGYI